MMENWARPYLVKYEQKPRLYYAVLGDIAVDKTIQKFAGNLPNGVGFRSVDAEFFRKGQEQETLQQFIPELAQSVAEASSAVIVEGEVSYSNDLDYLRDVVDFLTFLCDVGGRVVYDPYMMSWFSKSDWCARADAGQLFNPFDHVRILASKTENGQFWYHSHGLLKFGRPDLSVHSVSPTEAPLIKIVMEKFIVFQSLGGVMEADRTIEIKGLAQKYSTSSVQGSPEDPNFNNYHIEIKTSPES